MYLVFMALDRTASLPSSPLPLFCLLLAQWRLECPTFRTCLLSFWWWCWSSSSLLDVPLTLKDWSKGFSKFRFISFAENTGGACLLIFEAVKLCVDSQSAHIRNGLFTWAADKAVLWCANYPQLCFFSSHVRKHVKITCSLERCCNPESTHWKKSFQTLILFSALAIIADVVIHGMPQPTAMSRLVRQLGLWISP